MARFYGHNRGYLKKGEAKYYLALCGVIILPVIFYWEAISYISSGWVLFSACLLILYVVMLGQPFFNFLRNKSARFYRGRLGELGVRELLTKLPDSYCVFEDICLEEGRGNLDFVVVGPTGVYVLEVKNHYGHVDYNGDNLLLNGRVIYEKNFIRQVHGQTWAVKELIREQIGMDIYVVAVLVFAHPETTMHFGYQMIGHVYILQKDFLLGLFSRFRKAHFPRHKVEHALFQVLNN